MAGPTEKEIPKEGRLQNLPQYSRRALFSLAQPFTAGKSDNGISSPMNRAEVFLSRLPSRERLG